MDDTHLLKHIKQAILVWSFRQNIFLGSLQQNCSILSCYAIAVYQLSTFNFPCAYLSNTSNYSIIINRLVEAGIRNEIVIAYCIHIGRCQRVKERGKPILFRLYHSPPAQAPAPRRASKPTFPIRRFQCMLNAFKLF